MSTARSNSVYLYEKFLLKKMDYNTQLPQLILPEYGRSVHRMVEYCMTLENKDERNKCANAIIMVMGQLNPHLRDVADYTHKLWDHLFIMSNFDLDVDSPYPKPQPSSFNSKPEKVVYPSGKIRYKHYGKITEEIIEKACDFEEGAEKEELKRTIANHLKKSHMSWAKDAVPDEVILGHLLELSKGKLKIEDASVLTSNADLMKKNNINLNQQQNLNPHKKTFKKNFKFNKNKYKH
jgi:predicted small metal-binding protein